MLELFVEKLNEIESKSNRFVNEKQIIIEACLYFKYPSFTVHANK